MELIFVAALLASPFVTGTPSALGAKPISSASREAPALAGIRPPVGTTLVNMDIFVSSHPRGEPAVYELRSPLPATAFGNRYALNAERAGYQVVAPDRLVVGVRADGTSIRLRILAATKGATAILTVRPPTKDRA